MKMGKEVKENLGRVVLASVAGSGGFVSGFIGIAGPQNEVLWLYCTHMLEYIYMYFLAVDRAPCRDKR